MRAMAAHGCVWTGLLMALFILRRTRRPASVRSRASAPPPTSSMNSYVPMLIDAAKAGKPQPLQLAIWEACHFEAGLSDLSRAPGLPETWQQLNRREQLLLHLLYRMVPLDLCATVLGCSEHYIYAMRSAIRKKLALDPAQRLEHEMASWMR